MMTTNAKWCGLVLFVAGALAACHQPDATPLSDPEPIASQEQQLGLMCEEFCLSAEGYYMELCEMDSSDPLSCPSLWQDALVECVQRQCALNVTVPDLVGLTAMAPNIVADRIGPGYSIIDTNLHCYNTDFCDPSHGSYVFTLINAKGEYAFLEMGASLYLRPILTMGIDTRPAADELGDTIAQELEETYGGGPYTLTRRFLSAAYPILEYTDGVSTYFYSVGTRTAEDAFELTDDPDADLYDVEWNANLRESLWESVLKEYS